VTPQRLVPQHLLVLLALALSATLPASAATEMTLYRGEPVSTQNITLGGWGSGYAVESQKEYYSGTSSIQIHTDGYYAGGRIDFTPPVDLTDALANRETYLVFTVRFPAIEADSDLGGAGPALPSTDRPPGLGPSGPYAGGGAAGEATGPAMGYFRVVAVVNGMSLVADDQPIDIRRTESGWTTLSLPLAALRGARPSGRAMLSRLVVFGDRPDDFYIGEIRTAIDDTDIVFDEAPEDQTVSPGDLVQLNATANGGLANLEFVWDFDKQDGLQEDAYGETVQHVYTDPGTYIVTLRVRDINGVKPDLVQEVTVTVAQ